MASNLWHSGVNPHYADQFMFTPRGYESEYDGEVTSATQKGSYVVPNADQIPGIENSVVVKFLASWEDITDDHAIHVLMDAVEYDDDDVIPNGDDVQAFVEALAIGLNRFLEDLTQNAESDLESLLEDRPLVLDVTVRNGLQKANVLVDRPNATEQELIDQIEPQIFRQIDNAN